MKKIEYPVWAPDNIGEILKKIRTACGITDLRESEEARDFCRNVEIGFQLYTRVESGQRKITESEIEDVIYSLHLAVGNRLHDVTRNPVWSEMPAELKNIIQETLEGKHETMSELWW